MDAITFHVLVLVDSMALVILLNAVLAFAISVVDPIITMMIIGDSIVSESYHGFPSSRMESSAQRDAPTVVGPATQSVL